MLQSQAGDQQLLSVEGVTSPLCLNDTRARGAGTACAIVKGPVPSVKGGSQQSCGHGLNHRTDNSRKDQSSSPGVRVLHTNLFVCLCVLIFRLICKCRSFLHALKDTWVDILLFFLFLLPPCDVKENHPCDYFVICRFTEGGLRIPPTSPSPDFSAEQDRNQALEGTSCCLTTFMHNRRDGIQTYAWPKVRDRGGCTTPYYLGVDCVGPLVSLQGLTTSLWARSSIALCSFAAVV